MLTETEITEFIQADRTSEQKRMATVGQRYYEGDHDILRYRMFYYNADGKLVEDTFRSNNRIPHPFFTELVDQLAAYMLSGNDNPIRSDSPDLQAQLDLYFDESFWSEVADLITGATAKGFEYLCAYKSAADRLAFQCADSLGVVEVRARDTDDGCQYIIFWYVDRVDKGRKHIKRIQVWSQSETWFYVQADAGRLELDRSESINPRPHVVYIDETGARIGSPLGFIPFWRLDNSKKRFSGLKPIKALIDDYDLMECGLSNNLQDFDTPLHVVTGFQGDDLDELQRNLKTKKIVGVESDGGVDVKTVDVPYEARRAKAEEDEKNIYRFGMGFNAAQSGDGNITNVVIRSRYTLLDLKANKLEKRLKALLRDVLRVVLAEINEKQGTNYQPADVYFDFQRHVPTNEQEIAQIELARAQTIQSQVTTLLNTAATIGEEATLKAICELLELDYDAISSALASDPPPAPAQAMGALRAVVASDE